jgi:GTP 3',8-cyclase
VRFIKEMNLETGSFSIVEGGEGGDCRRCNRLRLTSDGQILPCLFSDLGFSVRELGAEQALRLAIADKPATGTINRLKQFSNIGG